MTERSIDWLRSTTTTVREFTKTGEDDEQSYTRTAVFAIKGGEDIPSGEGAFAPAFATVVWINDQLARMTVSGPKRLATGELSDRTTLTGGRANIPDDLRTMLEDWYTGGPR